VNPDPIVGLMIGFLTILAMGFAAYGGIKLMDRFARCDRCDQVGRHRPSCRECRDD
jgi:hypothetical protein